MAKPAICYAVIGNKYTSNFLVVVVTSKSAKQYYGRDAGGDSTHGRLSDILFETDSWDGAVNAIKRAADAAFEGMQTLERMRRELRIEERNYQAHVIAALKGEG